MSSAAVMIGALRVNTSHDVRQIGTYSGFAIMKEFDVICPPTLYVFISDNSQVRKNYFFSKLINRV